MTNFSSGVADKGSISVEVESDIDGFSVVDGGGGGAIAGMREENYSMELASREG